MKFSFIYMNNQLSKQLPTAGSRTVLKGYSMGLREGIECGRSRALLRIDSLQRKWAFSNLQR